MAWIKHTTKGTNTPIVENILEWDSDDDNAVDIRDGDAKDLCGSMIFGFHPYKEIIFVHLFSSRVVAYHFESSKVQDLGELRLRYPQHMLSTAFVYSPCWTGELSENSYSLDQM